MMGIADSNGKSIKYPELTEEELKRIAESLDEKYGSLSIESTLNFFEFVDMWKRNFGELLDKTPEVGYAKVVHGEWIRPTKINGRTFDIPHCSVCGDVPCDTKNYCPNCGARMEKEKEHYWLHKREEEAYPCIGRNLPFVFYSHYLECPNCGAHEKYDNFNPKFEAPQSCPECGVKLKGIK